MKPLRLKHTFACDENWNAMSGEKTCRHCDACDRDVVDLSSMTESDAYRLARDQLAAGELCAVFEITDGRIIFQPEPVPRIRIALAAAALTIPLLGGCDDTERPATVQTITQPERREPVDSSFELEREEPRLSTQRQNRTQTARSKLFEIYGLEQESSGPLPMTSGFIEGLDRVRRHRKSRSKRRLGIIISVRE